MNPRVSRSSALASKATGFPIAKIAARLAVGYTLDEIPNDITRETPASFEPTIDYVVTKVPRWAFEKFPGLSTVLGTKMQSVGEAMAIGRTFAESLQKGLRSLEHGRWGLNADPSEELLAHVDDDVRRRRLDAGVRATFKTVDTCGAEFAAATPYHYGTYEDDDEVRAGSKPRVIILGSGPNRIGQGIEFDYCCVQATFALRDAGFETIMVNCNPETVSTDYDTADRLYFEPLTHEDVLNIVDVERAATEHGAGEFVGIIVGLGGQTPLKLADRLPRELILGTSPESIDMAEDRERWSALCARLEIPQPAGGTAATIEDALRIVDRIGYPVLVRPSYVLG